MGSDLKRFYLRRTLRIFPLYYAVIALVWSQHGMMDVGGLLTFSYNIRAFFSQAHGGMMAHFWTLCVEEQFYLLFPLILMFTPRRFRIPVVSLLIVGSKAFQIHAHRSQMMPLARILLPYCGEDLLWGCLAGMIELKTRPGRREGTACFLAGLPIPGPRLEHAAASPAFARRSPRNCVVDAVRGRIRPWWSSGPGGASHAGSSGHCQLRPWPIWVGSATGFTPFTCRCFRATGSSRSPTAFSSPARGGELALTIGLAAASWRFFEGPINRLKDRWGSKAGTVENPSPQTDPRGPADATLSK